MTRNGCKAPMGQMLAVLGLAVALVAGAALVAGPQPAAAQRIDDDAAAKAYWQGRYRSLRMKEARLVQTVKLATKEYADSNRRTYRRSGVRHFHRTNANDAKAELELVRAELETIYDDARSAGIPLFWLDEVAEEPIDMERVEGLGVYADDGQFGGKGAYAEETESDDAEAGPTSTDDGRNPLHTGEGDEPASLDDTESKRFDYEAWRKDRREYEKERAPERHLEPDDVEPDEEP
jgi:hypothetical protein